MIFVHVQILDATEVILTYRVDHPPEGEIRGRRVLVPVGRHQRLGIILGLCDSEPEGVTVRPVVSILDDEPIITEELLKLCQRVSSYYIYPLGLTLLLALPELLREKSPEKIQSAQMTRAIILTVSPDEIKDRAFDERLGELFTRYPSGLPYAVLKTHLKSDWQRFITKARKKGWIATVFIPDESIFESCFGQKIENFVPEQLTEDQSRIMEQAGKALERQEFSPYLLYGVTGSGKTEIYLRLIEKALSMGKSALVLAPEIALITQLEAIFRNRFGETLAVWHSGLSPKVRLSQWRAVLKGHKRVALGTRSAVFLPLKNCGLIIVDEEHDLSYKQEDRMRYNARDVALMRAQMLQIPIILGSATPSLQSYHRAREGHYRLFTMTRRVHGQLLPEIEVVDMRRERSPKIFSNRLRKALEENFASGLQSLLFLNRRGYAPYIFCRHCGFVATCDRCSIALTYHIDRDNLRCHYCGFTTEKLTTCPVCQKSVLLYLGFGTERIEEEVKKILPDASIGRIDRDVIKNMKDLVGILNRIRKGEVHVIIGTQMITKGHDFPLLSLTGVINADVALTLPDFRSGEITAQQLLQVAGRAGRRETTGKVIIQTYNPFHYVIESAVNGNYSLFCEKELESREKLFYPPYSRMARLICESTDMNRAHETVYTLAEFLRETGESYGCVIIGPAPAPFFRLRNRYRWHILVKARHSSSLTELLTKVWHSKTVEKLRRRAHLIIDRDPMTCL
ncbi:MAG: replication restart helicase PriA [Thermodesulforhabdaceae bacterium]